MDRRLARADESIAVSRRRDTRFWEFSAQLSSPRGLGPQGARDIEAALAEVEAWLEMSGAKSYEPFLHVERAEVARLMGEKATRASELRQAHRLFTEIGAPIRAAEVAKELGL